MNNHQNAIEWTRKLREQITGDPSRVRIVWDNLKPSQREFILHAAGLSGRLSVNKWCDLSHQEMRFIYNGLIILERTLMAFKGCIKSDFKKAVNEADVSQHNNAINQLKERAKQVSLIPH